MGQRTSIAERRLRFRASDGAEVTAFAASPQGVRGAPRVTLAPEIFGLTPWIESVARRLAHEGFQAIAPEIFVRDPEPLADRATWMARMARLDVPQAVADLRSALEQLDGGGKTAAIGFCLGGALALLLAADGGLTACVDCYGRVRWASRDAKHPVDPIDATPRIGCPVLAVYGRRDAGIPVGDVEAMARGFPKGSELALYEAGHAFLNDTRPDTYVADQATLAWGKIVGFLRRHLG